jgi:hypothetical protein
MGAASAAAEGRKHHARAAIIAVASGRHPLRMPAPMVNDHIRIRMPATARNARNHIHTLATAPSVRIRIHIPALPASIRIRSHMRVLTPRIMAIAMPRTPRWMATGVLRKTPATNNVASIATMRRRGRISRQRIPSRWLPRSLPTTAPSTRCRPCSKAAASAGIERYLKGRPD